MIIAVDLMDDKLEYAKQFGATHTVKPGRQGREAWATRFGSPDGVTDDAVG
jgi:Zn-dependent alcohol dehydrogenase